MLRRVGVLSSLRLRCTRCMSGSFFHTTARLSVYTRKFVVPVRPEVTKGVKSAFVDAPLDLLHKWEAQEEVMSRSESANFKDAERITRRLHSYLGRDELSRAVTALEQWKASPRYRPSAAVAGAFVHYYLRKDRFSEALSICQKFKREGVVLDSHIFSEFMQYFTRHRDFSQVHLLYDHMRSEGLSISIDHIGIIVEAMFKAEKFRDVIHALEPVLAQGARQTFLSVYRVLFWSCVELGDWESFRKFWQRFFPKGAVLPPVDKHQYDPWKRNALRPSATAIVILLRSVSHIIPASEEHVKWVFSELQHIEHWPVESDISDCIGRALDTGKRQTAIQMYNFFAEKDIKFSCELCARLLREFGFTNVPFARSLMQYAQNKGNITPDMAIAYLEIGFELQLPRQVHDAFKLLELLDAKTLPRVQQLELRQLLVADRVQEGLDYIRATGLVLNVDDYASLIEAYAVSGNFEGVNQTFRLSLESEVLRIHRVLLSVLRSYGVCQLQPGETSQQRLQRLEDLWEECLALMRDRLNTDSERRAALSSRANLSTRLAVGRIESYVRLNYFADAAELIQILLKSSNWIPLSLPFAICQALVANKDSQVSKYGKGVWATLFEERKLPRNAKGPWSNVEPGYPKWTKVQIPADHVDWLMQLTTEIPEFGNGSEL